MNWRIKSIRKQIDRNKKIPDVKVLKVLQKRKLEHWDNDEREKFIALVKEHGNNPRLISMQIGIKDIQ